MSADLSGTSILVTGAGRGLGREMATALAEAGASVALMERDRPELDEAAGEIGAATDPGRVLAVQGDVTSADDAMRAVSEVNGAFGRLDMLVNNAALGPQEHSPHQHRAAPADLGGRSGSLAGDAFGQRLRPLHHGPRGAPRHAGTRLGADRQRDHQPGHDDQSRPRPLRSRQGGDRGAHLDPRLRAGGDRGDGQRAGSRRGGPIRG